MGCMGACAEYGGDGLILDGRCGRGERVRTNAG